MPNGKRCTTAPIIPGGLYHRLDRNGNDQYCIMQSAIMTTAGVWRGVLDDPINGRKVMTDFDPQFAEWALVKGCHTEESRNKKPSVIKAGSKYTLRAELYSQEAIANAKKAADLARRRAAMAAS